jgi:uncharacterized membrane protein YdjX (TVP38/TMEM64 family)
MACRGNAHCKQQVAGVVGNHRDLIVSLDSIVGIRAVSIKTVHYGKIVPPSWRNEGESKTREKLTVFLGFLSIAGMFLPMRLFVWFLALAILFLIAWMIWGGGWEARFDLEGSVAWLRNAGPWAWAAGMGMLVADLVLPVPGTVVMSALGFIYGPWLGGLIACAGSVCGGLAGYAVGRCFGEKTARCWLGDKDYEKGRSLFGRGGGWLVALSRALPILPEVMACTAGLVRMPFRKFVLALVCGSLPMAFVFAAIGAAGHDAPAWAMVFSLLLPAALWAIARKWWV